MTVSEGGARAYRRKLVSSWGFKGREKNLAKEIIEDESLSCGNPKAAERDVPARGVLGLEETDGLGTVAVG